MLKFVRSFATAVALVGAVAAAPFATAQTVYKVGSTPTGVPFTFLDVKSNTIQGAMVDLITAIGDDAGFKVDVQATPFSALIPSLTSSKIDIISAAMLITDARKEVIDFSDPVFPYPEGMVVNESDNTPYKGLADLKGTTVGVQVGTVYVDFLKKNGEFAEVKIYDSLADVLRDVSLGRIKAGFGDGPILAYQLSQNKDFKAKLVKTYEPKMAGSVGIGVRKSDAELMKKINVSLAKLKASGTLDKILVKWNLK
jgi:polar amino acid transport system substrate-binding protein